jgi:hypothetical protein
MARQGGGQVRSTKANSTVVLARWVVDGSVRSTRAGEDRGTTASTVVLGTFSELEQGLRVLDWTMERGTTLGLDGGEMRDGATTSSARVGHGGRRRVEEETRARETSGERRK